MNPINLLVRIGSPELTPEEETFLTHELSTAYHMDEAAASSRDVGRIAEKIRARLRTDDAVFSESATSSHGLLASSENRDGNA